MGEDAPLLPFIRGAKSFLFFFWLPAIKVLVDFLYIIENFVFTDTFRALHPDQTGAYSWWSYMFKARSRNTGWRIDYFLVSNRLFSRVTDAAIHADVMGSDHCPVSVTIE